MKSQIAQTLRGPIEYTWEGQGPVLLVCHGTSENCYSGSSLTPLLDKECLEELSPRQRAVVVQRYFLEMSEKEMSEALDSPPGTVKWLLNAARTRLRSLLGSERMAE